MFIEAEPGLAKQAGVDGLELDFHQLRTASLDMFFKPYQSRSSLLPFGTSVFAIYEELYEREFKFVQRDDHRVALFERDEDNAAFVETAFGGFPNDGFLAPLEKAYMDVFNPLKLTPNAEMSTRVIREELRTPLYFTRQDITREPARRSDNLTLFVVDPRNPLDLIDLWNIRSFSRYVVPVNIQWLVESSGYFRDLITKNHHPLPGNPNGVMTHSIVQFGRSITEERAKAVAQEALSGLPQGSWALQFGYERLWHDDGEDDQFWPPERARIAAKSHDLELAASRDHMDLSVRFPSLSPEFVTRYGDSAARWVNVVNFQTYDDKENIATVLPSDFTKTRSPRIRIGGHAIVSREGWVLPQKYPHHREYLHLLDGSQAVTEWLGQQGVAAKSSDAGRIAEQVLKALGGFWGAYLLADEETLRCLDRMAKSVRRHADGTVEEFPDRALPVVEWNALIARRKNRQFMPRLSLDEFVNANILKLGLSVECPNCLKKNWISLKGMDEEVGCERCLTRFPFPQGSLDFQHTPWQYRVVGPFSVPDYADGAYATVLALRAFSQNLGSHSKLTYATGLELTIEPPKTSEVDFVFWYKRDYLFGPDSEPLLVFGEAKSFAGKSFKPEDVARMERVSVKFPGAFIVFATLKEELSAEERNEIARLAVWGRERLVNGRQRAPVIILTGTELFSDGDIAQRWSALAEQRATFASQHHLPFDNLWTLADVTQQVYLGLPDRYAEMRARISVATNTSPPSG